MPIRMIDVKSKENEKESEKAEEYSPNLLLHLEEPFLKKLGIDVGSLKLGDEFYLSAIADVASISKNSLGGEERVCVSFQIKKLGLEDQNRKNPPEEILYNKAPKEMSQ